jgi:hypothetical protein
VVTEHFRGSGRHKYIKKRGKQGGIEARYERILHFGHFNKRKLFYRLPLKARALNGPGYGVYPGLLQKRVLYDVTAGGGVRSLLYSQKYSKIAVVHTTT